MTHPFGPDALPETADDDPKRQVECWIAPSPSTLGRLFASWMDLSHAPLPTDGWGIGYGLSSNFGQSWGFFAVGDTDLVDVDIPPPTGSGGWKDFQVDPGCAVGADDSGGEVLYLSGLDEIPPQGPGELPLFSAVFFARYRAGSGWEADYVAQEQAPYGVVDKPLMSADASSDPNRRKRLYVHWSQLATVPDPPLPQDLLFRRSLNAGADILQQPTVPLATSEIAVGSVSAVGPAAELCVAWLDGERPPGGSWVRYDIRTRTCLDPGATPLQFEPEVTAVNDFAAAANDRMANFRVNSLPAIAVDNSTCARRGRFYIAYMSKAGGSTADTDVYVVMSKNKGLCWEQPVLVTVDPPSNPSARQFMPGLAVNDKGHVGMVFYDTREDTSPANAKFRTYFAYSKDGGLTFEAPLEVAGLVSDPRYPAIQEGLFLGDYNAMTAQGTSFHPIWTDLRAWDGSDVEIAGDIWTAAVDVADDPVGPPDFDWDCDVDLQDFAFFQNCFTGANP